MKDQKPNPNSTTEKKSPQSGFRDDNRRAGEAPKGGKPAQGKGGQPQVKGTGQSSHR